MGKKVICINEGKLSEFKLHSIWLRERLTGSKFVDQNNLQRLYEPSLLDDNLFINSHNVNENILNVEFSDGAKGLAFMCSEESGLMTGSVIDYDQTVHGWHSYSAYETRVLDDSLLGE